jgi:uncharacterized protein CbrC (UPF0167 family)
MELPHFKYHPNPIATGSVVPSVEVCPVCGESRGFAYDGIPYGSKEIEEEVAFRTPGFASWQQEHWYTHCGDAAEFLGPMGKEELEQTGTEAIEVVREESGKQGADWQYYFSKLDRKFTATAYLFRCRHCGRLGGYSDCQ